MSKISLDLLYPKLDEVFKKHQREIMLVLAASMQTNRAMMFDKDGADNGKEKWAPLVLRSGRPLQKSGVLRKSMGPKNDGIRPGHEAGSVLKIEGKAVTIGTDLGYARMMNDGTTKMPGGVLKPVRAKALKIPLEGGDFMFRKSVKIPARPMDTITPEDEREWAETLMNYMSELLSEAEVG